MTRRRPHAGPTPSQDSTPTRHQLGTRSTMSGNHWLILLCRERVRTQALRCICGGGWRCRRERYRAAFIEHLKIGGLFYFSLHSDLDHQGQGGHGARSALPVLASSWIQELVHEEQHKLIWCALQQKQLSLPGCQSQFVLWELRFCRFAQSLICSLSWKGKKMIYSFHS